MGLCDWDKFPVTLRLVAQSTLQDGRWLSTPEYFLRTKISEAFLLNWPKYSIA